MEDFHDLFICGEQCHILGVCFCSQLVCGNLWVGGTLFVIGAVYVCVTFFQYL